MAQSQEQINIELNIIDKFTKVLNAANKKFAELNSLQIEAVKNADKATAKKLANAKNDLEAGRKHIRALREEEQIQLRILRLEERRLSLEQRQNRYNRQNIGNVLRGGSGGVFGAMGGYNFGGRGAAGFGRNLLGNAFLMGAGGRAGGMMGMGMMGGLGAGAIAGLGAGALALGGAAAFQQAYFDIDQAKEIGMERERVRRRLQIVSPIGRAGAVGLQRRLDTLADKYGVPSEGLEQGFGKYYIASKKAGISDETIMKRLETFTATFTALGLDQEEVKRVMKAFEQITDKNRVMSEELRHQLGDAGLAGIVQDVAKGLGITTKELDKRMKKGEITPDEFFMAITKEWNRLYMKIAQQNASSYEAQAERFNNKLRTHYDEYWNKTVMPFERKWLEFKMDFLGVATKILDMLPGAGDYFGISRNIMEKQPEDYRKTIQQRIAAENILGGNLTGAAGSARIPYLPGKAPAMNEKDRLRQEYEYVKDWVAKHPEFQDAIATRENEEFKKKARQQLEEDLKRTGDSGTQAGVSRRNALEILLDKRDEQTIKNIKEYEYNTQTMIPYYEGALGKNKPGPATGGGAGADKTKLKSDYHTPRIININILTGAHSSLVNGFTIENKPSNGDTIDGTMKGKIEQVLYDVITDAATSIARATK